MSHCLTLHAHLTPHARQSTRSRAPKLTAVWSGIMQHALQCAVLQAVSDIGPRGRGATELIQERSNNMAGIIIIDHSTTYQRGICPPVSSLHTLHSNFWSGLSWLDTLVWWRPKPLNNEKGRKNTDSRHISTLMVNIKHNLRKSKGDQRSGFLQKVQSKHFELCRMSLGGYVTPSSQCDNIERFCLDLIALAELLLVIRSVSQMLLSQNCKVLLQK